MSISVRQDLSRVALLISVALAAAPAAGATKVYLLAGQSNMAGKGTAADLPPPYNTPQANVRFWDNGSWVALQGAYGATPSQFGPEVSFGYRLNAALSADDVYLVKYALGGTDLANNWNPNGTNNCYTAFTSRVDAALANLRTAGRSPIVEGMIWMQGESDALNSTFAANYQTNLTNFVQEVRSDIGAPNGAPNMGFVLGRITTYYGTTTDNGNVRTAQATIPGVVGNASWFTTDDLQMGPEAGHYGTQGQIDLGIRFADAIGVYDVPEPSALVLLVVGLLAMLTYVAWRNGGFAKRIVAPAKRLCVFLLLSSAAGVAMAATPIQLSAGPQLFIDDYLIQSQSGLSRSINSPTPLPSPVVTSSTDNCWQPWCTVLRDPVTRQFRMWYDTPDLTTTPASHPGYMESADGINWVRPHQVLSNPGSMQTGASVIDEGPGYANPSARYKFAWWGNDGGEGFHLAASANGLTWTSTVSQPPFSTDHDIVHLSYDPLHEQYIASTSTMQYAPYLGRRIPTQRTSADLIHWSDPTVTVTPAANEGGVTQFYGMSGIVARGDLLVGMVKVLRDDLAAEGAPSGAYGTGYTVLCWSRDGVTWQRDTQPFMNRNPVAGTWDHAMAWGESQLLVGDQTYIYYGG